MPANVTKGFHRRPLPEELIAFGSKEGRGLLVDALADGNAEAFYPLVAHLHTQAEPAWCGLGTLVTVLNALEIDPGRVWKGSWRWFGEELLICCKALEVTAAEGLTLAEVACLAQCNGASVRSSLAGENTESRFREHLEASVRSPDGPFIVANYSRRALGQTGAGHFSPLAAYHRGSDRVLVLDVARFKYPPHWVQTKQLWRAMCEADPQSLVSRGWLSLEAAESPQVPTGLDRLARRFQLMGVPMCPVPPADAPAD